MNHQVIRRHLSVQSCLSTLDLWKHARRVVVLLTQAQEFYCVDPQIYLHCSGSYARASPQSTPQFPRQYLLNILESFSTGSWISSSLPTTRSCPSISIIVCSVASRSCSPCI